MVVSKSVEVFVASAATLQAIADPVRLSLLAQLNEAESKCVCDLQTEPPIAQNLLSYHLKVLKEAGLISATKRGRWIDYSLAPEALDRLRTCLPGLGEQSTARRYIQLSEDSQNLNQSVGQ
ncbi:ArsR/SmtB family transcription factor [Jonesia quinghaiensis]|uniref:ArsR/SmtB family transcription factor n=1 Tax=Jonesia quinghaiensis TaxID=262806 RepID=UPI00040DD96F